MINDGTNNVPDKTILIFSKTIDFLSEIEKKEKISKILTKPDKKRDWFTSHFYRCLPLVIGNQYGFIIKNEFDFSFIWNGKEEPESISFEFNETQEKLNNKYPRIDSHFGSGIITINPPFTLRTPPGINIMTINPPNYIIPNITVMTGVIEADNLRRNFSFNLKVQIPNIKVIVPAGSALAGFIPIPRYYADNFNIKYAEEIFNNNLIDEEFKAGVDADLFRKNIEPNLPNGVGRQYFNGIDVYQNNFLDHQKP